ncbi:MAG: hypothetical protein AVDCRST_MAG64-4171, partial [uncultured Phycisphaerae bacterium]
CRPRFPRTPWRTRCWHPAGCGGGSSYRPTDLNRTRRRSLTTARTCSGPRGGRGRHPPSPC